MEEGKGNGNGNGDGLHLLMFPFLAYGHINPFINLCHKITAVDPTTRLTFLTTPANLPYIASSSPASITIHSLPLPPVPGLPSGAEITSDLTMAQAELLSAAVQAMKPDVHALLSRLRPHFVVFDFAMPWIPSVAAPLGVKSIFFTIFAAISNAYLMVPSRRTDPAGPPPTVEDLKEPPPGFPATSSIATAGGVPTYQAQDFSYVFKTFGDQKPFCVYDRFVTCMTGCSAIISKSCSEMEGQYISYMESEYKKPMLLAGPVVPETPSGEELEERWGKWLDKFGEGSVVYCAFGSEAFLTDEEMRELVLGLEMTELPFLVVRNCTQGEEAMRKKLPAGLEKRVKERGVIHHGWVQQQLILQHKSVGCFVTHAGLSSLIEGLKAGCQLVMMPNKGDQYLNAALFAGDLGIGVEVRRHDRNGEFVREGVCEAVKKVMKGEKQIRENHKKWKDFLLEKGMEKRYMLKLVEKLKALLDN